MHLGRKMYKMNIRQLFFELSDRKTIAYVAENQYLKYFIGLKTYQDKSVFDASKLNHFRKCFGDGNLNQITELVPSKLSRHNEQEASLKIRLKEKI